MVSFMDYPKSFIAWLIVLGVFINTSLSGICFCGKTCTQDPGPEADIKVNSTFHMHWSDTPCKGCKLENFQTLKLVNSIEKRLHPTCFEIIFPLITLLNNPTTINHVHKSCVFPIFEPSPLSPFYLLNLSLLC